MSESKARLTAENDTLRRQSDTLRRQSESARMQVVRLLTYVRNMQQDFPDLPWPALPDRYDEMTWRYVA